MPAVPKGHAISKKEASPKLQGLSMPEPAIPYAKKMHKPKV